MKTKLILLLAASALALSSCKKEEEVVPTYAQVTFSGVFSPNAKAKINGIEVAKMKPQNVKKGDVLTLKDTGADIYHAAIYGYPSNGGEPFIVSPAYTEQGYTEGYIILNKGKNGAVTIVAQYTGGYTDCNLTYTVQ
jgi:hypothetical protein